MAFINRLGLFTSRQVQNQLTDMVSKATENLYNENMFRWVSNGQPIMDENDFDYIRGGFMTVGAVFECVDLIYKKIAASKPIVYEVKDKAKYNKWKSLIKDPNPNSQFLAKSIKEQAIEEVNIWRIDELLSKPNPNQTWNEFIRFVAGMYLLKGNAFIYGNGADVEERLWNEIFPLPHMHILSGGMLEPVKAYFLNYSTDTEKYFPVNQIEHVKTFNPDYSVSGSQLYGMPPLRAYNYSLQRSKLGQDQANKQFKNGGTFGLLSPKNKEDQFSSPQKGALKDALIDAHSSDEYLKRILPSNVAMEFLKLGLSIADLDLFKGLELTDEDIYRCFHVPLTYRSMEGSTFNNKSSDGKNLIYNAVAPVCDNISDSLTRFICEPYAKGKNGRKLVIHLAYEDLPEMQADMGELVTWLANADWLTYNEKRETMGWGKSSYAGMDTIFIKSGYKPIEDAAISATEFNNAFNELNQ